MTPTVDIAIVDGSATGTVANSPIYCLASVATVIPHKRGQLKAISTSGTATVKVAHWLKS